MYCQSCIGGGLSPPMVTHFVASYFLLSCILVRPSVMVYYSLSYLLLLFKMLHFSSNDQRSLGNGHCPVRLSVNDENHSGGDLLRHACPIEIREQGR